MHRTGVGVVQNPAAAAAGNNPAVAAVAAGQEMGAEAEAAERSAAWAVPDPARCHPSAEAAVHWVACWAAPADHPGEAEAEAAERSVACSAEGEAPPSAEIAKRSVGRRRHPAAVEARHPGTGLAEGCRTQADRQHPSEGEEGAGSGCSSAGTESAGWRSTSRSEGSCSSAAGRTVSSTR